MAKLKREDHIDYLAELIVSQYIANNHINEDNVYFHCLGVFKRFFSQDVDKVLTRKNDKGEQERDVYINREGIYDLLPEGLFHGHSHKQIKDRKETVQEFTQHKLEERSARQFFSPLEQEYYKLLVNKEIFEQNFYYAPETVSEFIDFFNLDHLGLNMYQQASLFFIIPHIPKITGNLGLTEACFEIILQEHVKFSDLINSVHPDPFVQSNSLFKSVLGVSSLCGNTQLNSIGGLLIEIGPLQESDSLIEYLNGDKIKLLNRLCDLFIQADIITQIRILLNETDEAFILGEESYRARLNYSTTI